VNAFEVMAVARPPALGALLVAATLLAACAAPGTSAQTAAPSPTPPSSMPSTDPPSARPPPGVPPTAVPGIELRTDADGKTAHVQRGGEVKLVLDLKGMYEFAWELQGKAEPVLSPIGERIYIGNGTNAYDVLAGGFSIYRFRAEQPGPVTLTLSKRSRADNAVIRTVRFDVIVD
jgi:hypothetical protein